MSVRARIFSASLAIGVLFANAANAVPITLYGSYTNSTGLYDADDDRGQVTCSVSCEGLLSSLPSGSYGPDVPSVLTADGFSTDSADLFHLANNSEAGELAFVNAVIDPDFVSGAATDAGGASSFSFTSAALYILLKIGASPDIALIWNTSGGEQTYSYTGLRAEGAGLSHYVEFGGPVSVPEPETFLLLAPGVLLMALRMRRRKVAA
jgi:hypothetical protein